VKALIEQNDINPDTVRVRGETPLSKLSARGRRKS